MELNKEQLEELVTEILKDYTVLGYVAPNIENPTGYYFASGKIVPYQEVDRLNGELKRRNTEKLGKSAVHTD